MTAAVHVDVAPRTRGYPPAWWGMALLIATEAMIFLALLSAYFFVRATSSSWPLGGLPTPEMTRTSIFSVILIGSSVPVLWAEAALKRGHMRQVGVGFAIAFLMGAAFLVNTAYDFTHMEFGWRVNAYSSLFHTIIGLHAIHVLVGLVMSAVVQLKVWLGKVSRERHVTPDVFALYWHFVDGVWIFVFLSLFVSVAWIR